MGLLDGKRLLVTGVITDASIAFAVARVAQEQGAEVVLTGFGRMSLVERVANKLPKPAPVIELDVSDESQLASLAERVGEHIDGLDGVLHSIGFAPASCLGGGFLDAPWEDVSTAVHVSAYSLKSLAVATLPLFGESGGSLTMAAKSIPGFSAFEDAWSGRAPLGWDNANAEPVARTAVALMSDWLPATTGEIVHVDGGFHAMGV